MPRLQQEHVPGTDWQSIEILKNRKCQQGNRSKSEGPSPGDFGQAKTRAGEHYPEAFESERALLHLQFDLSNHNVDQLAGNDDYFHNLLPCYEAFNFFVGQGALAKYFFRSIDGHNNNAA